MSRNKAETEITQSSVHLDAVRGIAALIVVTGHVRGLFFSSLFAPAGSATHVSVPSQAMASGPVHKEAKITIGHEAVMIFFVLSGYLVGGAALRAVKKNRWSWKDYLGKRLTRLWVVLLPALLFGLLLDHAGLRLFPEANSIYAGPVGQTVVPTTVGDGLAGKIIAGNAMFLQTIVVPPLGTNGPLWSLANEFWYYMAFPLLILAFAKTTLGWMRAGFLILFVLIGAGVGRSIDLLFPIWLLGAVISVLPLKIPKRAVQALAWTFAIILCASLILVRRSSMSFSASEWTIAVIFTLLLYILLHQTEKASAGIYQKSSKFLSQISYTLYLVHMPLAVFLCAWLNRPWHTWSKTIPNVAATVGLSGLLVLFAYLFYLAFEANTDRVRRFLLEGKTGKSQAVSLVNSEVPTRRASDSAEQQAQDPGMRSEPGAPFVL